MDKLDGVFMPVSTRKTKAEASPWLKASLCHTEFQTSLGTQTRKFISNQKRGGWGSPSPQALPTLDMTPAPPSGRFYFAP